MLPSALPASTCGSSGVLADAVAWSAERCLQPLSPSHLPCTCRLIPETVNWLLPGMAPTGKKLKFAAIAVVKFDPDVPDKVRNSEQC